MKGRKPIFGLPVTMFNLPLGARFQFHEMNPGRTYVLLDRSDCGLIAEWKPDGDGSQPQAIYSITDTREGAKTMLLQPLIGFEPITLTDLQIDTAMSLLDAENNYTPPENVVANRRKAARSVLFWAERKERGEL